MVIAVRFINGEIDDITICPIAIAYEKVLEAELYSHEMLGESKPPENLQVNVSNTSPHAYFITTHHCHYSVLF